MALKRTAQRVKTDGDRYRNASMAYAAGHPPSPVVSECSSCRRFLGRKKFPQDNVDTCKRCICRVAKLHRKEFKVACKVSPEKIRFAEKLRRNMTPAEQYLWVKLSALAPVFSCQTIVFGYIADFACVIRKLIVEVDGPIHEDRREYDKERDLNLRRRGFRTIRFTNEEVLNERLRVLGAIIEAL